MALANIFIFSERFGNKGEKAKAMSNNYYITYDSFITLDSRARGTPAPPGNNFTKNPHKVKPYGWEISVKDGSPTGTEITHEFWLVTDFYTDLFSSSGDQVTCDEAWHYFDGTGRMYDKHANWPVDVNWFNIRGFHNVSDARIAITNDIIRQYRLSQIVCHIAGTPTFGPYWVREDEVDMPSGGCIDNCGARDRALDGLRDVKVWGDFAPKSWIIQGIIN